MHFGKDDKKDHFMAARTPSMTQEEAREAAQSSNINWYFSFHSSSGDSELAIAQKIGFTATLSRERREFYNAVQGSNPLAKATQALHKYVKLTIPPLGQMGAICPEARGAMEPNEAYEKAVGQGARRLLFDMLYKQGDITDACCRPPLVNLFHAFYVRHDFKSGYTTSWGSPDTIDKLLLCTMVIRADYGGGEAQDVEGSLAFPVLAHLESSGAAWAKYGLYTPQPKSNRTGPINTSADTSYNYANTSPDHQFLAILGVFPEPLVERLKTHAAREGYVKHIWAEPYDPPIVGYGGPVYMPLGYSRGFGYPYGYGMGFGAPLLGFGLGAGMGMGLGGFVGC
ncbi:hypothetical protein YB2330_003066 [Saitoella coloradoensis]